MEFPHIGSNCSYKSCNRLDFLPMKCDLCKVVLCSDHFPYVKHDCPEPNSRDVQVPVCPLCGVPVPGKRGEPPDAAVGAHIDSQCTSDPAKERRNKIFTNKCSYKGCKTKEMVRLVCSECNLNFCLKHRHITDHSCIGKLAAKRQQAANAALARINSSQIQGNMTEDEALAHALALSMQDVQSSVQSRDANLARAFTNQRVGDQPSSKCNIS